MYCLSTLSLSAYQPVKGKPCQNPRCKTKPPTRGTENQYDTPIRVRPVAPACMACANTLFSSQATCAAGFGTMSSSYRLMVLLKTTLTSCRREITMAWCTGLLSLTPWVCSYCSTRTPPHESLGVETKQKPGRSTCGFAAPKHGPSRLFLTLTALQLRLL